MDIQIEKVMANPEQPRKYFAPEALEELAQSIRENGAIQPIVVEEAGEYYVLHDGERRLRAAKMAGLREIPATVIPPLNGDGSQKRLLRALVANLQREDLSPIEEAKGYECLRKQGLSANQIAEKTGKHASQIYNRMMLLQLDEEIQELIHHGEFPSSEIVRKAILLIPSKRERIELAEKAIEKHYSIKTITTAASVLRKRSLAARRPQKERALDQVRERRGGRPISRPKWDAAAQAGMVPPWPGVEKAARETCRQCILGSSASKEVCQQCPAPQMLLLMVEMTEKVKA